MEKIVKSTGAFTLDELKNGADARPKIVPFGSTTEENEAEGSPVVKRGVVQFGGSSEVKSMLNENKNNPNSGPLGINSEGFKEKVNKSIDDAVDIFVGTAAAHKELVEKVTAAEGAAEEKFKAARKGIVGEASTTSDGSFHPAQLTHKESNVGVIEVDSVEIIEEEVVEVKEEVIPPTNNTPPVTQDENDIKKEGEGESEEGPWLKMNTFTKAAKRDGQSMFKRRKGASVEVYLPASNLMMRFYAINTVLKATQISKRLIEYGLYFDDYKVLESIYEHSEVLAQDGNKVSFAEWLQIIHNDDMNIVYLGSLIATVGDKNVDAMLMCGECGDPTKVQLNYMKLYNDNLTEDIKAQARLYDPTRTIAELQKDINIAFERRYTWSDDEGYTYNIHMSGASKHKDLTVAELAKEWIVRVNRDAFPAEVANDRTKTTAERLAWLHNAKPQLIQDYLPLVSMSILIDKITVYHKSNPTRQEVIRTSEKYDEVMDAINELNSDVINELDKEMFKYIPKHKMTLVTRLYKCNACGEETVSVLEKMNHLYFLEMMRVIHG